MNFSFAQDTDTLRKITEYFELGKRFYANDFQKMKILDLTDRGQLWKAIGIISLVSDSTGHELHNRLRQAQLVCVHLFCSQVRRNHANLRSRQRPQVNLNVALDALWDTRNIGYYQFKAGERAALLT